MSNPPQLDTSSYFNGMIEKAENLLNLSNPHPHSSSNVDRMLECEGKNLEAIVSQALGKEINLNSDNPKEVKKAQKSIKKLKVQLFNNLAQQLYNSDLKVLTDEAKKVAPYVDEKKFENCIPGTYKHRFFSILDRMIRFFSRVDEGNENPSYFSGVNIVRAYKKAEHNLNESRRFEFISKTENVSSKESHLIFKKEIDALQEANPTVSRHVVAVPLPDSSLAVYAPIAKTKAQALEQMRELLISKINSCTAREKIESGDFDIGSGMLFKNTIISPRTYVAASSNPGKKEYLANLAKDCGTVSCGEETQSCTTLRSGVASPKTEMNKELRAHYAKLKVTELVQMAVARQVEEREARGERFENHAEITESILSVSLLTPDLCRGIKDQLTGSISDERMMLNDQIEAFRELSQDGVLPIQVGDKTFQVTLESACFNFGVNKGAAEYGLGTWVQHPQNERAFKVLESKVTDLLGKHCEDPNAQDVKDLWLDIQSIRTAAALGGGYLKGSNQYELPTKLTLLANAMHKLDPSLQGTVNCMSGKDRTGVHLAIEKTLLSLRVEFGHYPTHLELESPGVIQDRFVEIYLKMLQSYGGLKVTEWNTGVQGYKADLRLYPESAIWGQPKNHAICEKLKGLSTLAGS